MNDEISLYERLRENEQTARKFYEVEKKILSILRFKDLFDTLLAEIKGQFNIPYVWLSIIENSEAHRLIESINDMDAELKASINIIDNPRDTVRRIPARSSTAGRATSISISARARTSTPPTSRRCLAAHP